MRSWTDRDADFVCDHYGIDLTLADIAKALGKSYPSVQSWVSRHGLAQDRRLTPKQLAYIRRHYGKTPAPAIAATLGRPVKTVQHAAFRLGLTKPIERMDATKEARLRELAASGMCNRCIGRDIRMNRSCVRRWRRQFGLPDVGTSGPADSCQECKERVRETTRRQLERAGLSSLAEVRVEAFREYARRHGWPEDLPPRCVQILEVLAREGPKTKVEIAAAIGMRHQGLPSRKVLSGGRACLGHSYLAHLQRLGLVVPLGRVYRRQYHWQMVYSIALGAERRFA